MMGDEWGVGHWPPGCWRPFSNASPFNTPIPAGATVHARSSQMVTKLLAGGNPNSIHIGTAGESGEYYKPVYYPDPAVDPLYHVLNSGVFSGYLPLPVGARPGGGNNGTGDHHMTIVYNGDHYGFWNAKVDDTARTISANTLSGTCTIRKSPLNGDAISVGDPPYSSTFNTEGATAAGFANMAGLIRAQEMYQGSINHAIFITSTVAASTFVWPATLSDGNDDAAQDFPPMGTLFQLNMPDATIATYPRWKQTILRAMKVYGAYLGDSSGAPSFAFQIESGLTYTVFGRSDPWVDYIAQQPVGNGLSVLGSGKYDLDLSSGLTWASYLRAMAPLGP